MNPNNVPYLFEDILTIYFEPPDIVEDGSHV